MHELSVWNYAYNRWQTYEAFLPEDRLHEFLPQYHAAQHMFHLYVQMGNSRLEAAMKVMEAVMHVEDGTEE